MTIANLAHIVLTGSLAGNEIWTSRTTIKYSAAPSSEAAFAADLDAMVGDAGWSTYQDYQVAHLRPADSLDSLRGYFYPVWPGAASLVAEHPINEVGSGASAVMPNQVALVGTLLTGLSGRRNRGRMYLPMTSFALTGQGQTDLTGCTNHANAIKAFLEAVGGHYAGGGTYVASSVGSTANLITQVRVDSRPDIQRRRANREAATTSFSADVDT